MAYTPPEQPMIRVRLPQGKEILGIVQQRLGGSRMRVLCLDGKERICRIPGRLRRGLWVRENDVVLIEIDDAAYNLINESYPFPRGKIFANVIDNLTKAKAKVIVFDIMFDSEDHTSKVLKNNVNKDCIDCIKINQDEQFKNSIVFSSKFSMENNSSHADSMYSSSSGYFLLISVLMAPINSSLSSLEFLLKISLYSVATLRKTFTSLK